MSNPYNRTLVTKWADGEHSFRLKNAQIFELERLCERGLGGIARQLTMRDWHFSYVRETVRLGLIGADMPPLRALQLVQTYIDDGSIADALPLAADILGVTLDPPAAQKKSTSAESGLTPTSASTPETSTATAQ